MGNAECCKLNNSEPVFISKSQIDLKIIKLR